MKYLSLCSGIEAASVAWHPLGWRPFAFSEIDAFPSAVLAHHYPTTPNLGDMTKFKEWPDATFDILVGGTPCQSFSVAGLRKGLHDPRGNLMLTFGAIAARYRPAWLVWENVPGVLSSNRGRDFGTFLGMLGELGYGFAYRVLDAQFFGVPQRRRRVFVVGYLGNWRAPFAVLFERHSLQGHPAPRREARKGIAGSVAGCLGGSSQSGGFRTTDLDGTGAFVPVAGDDALKTAAACPLVMSSGQANAEIASDRAPTLNCLHEAPILAAHAVAIRTANTGANGHGVADEVAHTLDQAQGQAVAIQANCIGRKDENGPMGVGAAVEVAYTLEARTEVQAVAFKASHYTRGKDGAPQEVAPPLSADADKGDQDTLIAFSCKDYGNDAGETAPTLRSMNHSGSHQNGGGQVAVAFTNRGTETDETAETLRAGSHGALPMGDHRQGNVAACEVADSLTVGANQTTGFVGDVVAQAAVAFNLRGREGGAMPEVSDLASMRAASGGSSRSYVATSPAIGWSEELTAHVNLAATIQRGGQGGRHDGVMIPSMQVRRLTPRECERLQGFPDDYTLIQVRGKPAADGPRYKALGNSFAVPVVRWIGERIQLVERIINGQG